MDVTRRAGATIGACVVLVALLGLLASVLTQTLVLAGVVVLGAAGIAVGTLWTAAASEVEDGAEERQQVQTRR